MDGCPGPFFSERKQLKRVRRCNSANDDHETLKEVLRIGNSAGDARAKAIFAWKEKIGEFRSG